MERISIDIDRSMAGVIGSCGLTQEIMDGLAPRLEEARVAVMRAAGSGWLEWMDLPSADPTPIIQYADGVRDGIDAVLVIGIGGSALGTIALSTALLPFYHNELSREERAGNPRLYVLDNVDPDEASQLLARLDLSKTLVNVISKSGTTGESMAGYLIVRDRLEALVGRDGLRERLVFATDPEGGVLRHIGSPLGIPMFDIPPGVGGRFSVLSSVGLLPAALAGMDVPALLQGAQDMQDLVAGSEGWDNPACVYAGVQYLHYTVFDRRVSVMMPYSARLRDVADWYRQLWAESLGKSVNRAGETVNIGPLPVKSLGVTDQHSQLQLYSEGPDDKVITFLGVGEFDSDLTIPAPGDEASPLSYLAGHSLGGLMWAEQKGTAWALAARGRPSITITVPRVDAYNMGALMYLLEVATAISGELYDVDAFNQPGVELSKKATYALMGRPGYEDLAREIH
jgi:glucose-6-phosphate isomerase